MFNNLRSSLMFQHGQQKTRLIKQFLKKFLNDWSLNLAAMLAYNLLISLLPIAVALFGILGLILKNNPDIEQDMKDRIIDAFPSDNSTRDGVRQVVNLAFEKLSTEAGVLFVMGLLFACFGASRLFIAMDRCMTVVYRLPERSFLRQNCLAFGTLFIFLIIIPIILAVSSAPTALLGIIPGGGGRLGTFIAGILFSFLIGFLLFEIIYWIIPNKKMSFKVTWCGALVAASTLELFVILFPLYVRRFMGNFTGQVGFAVILLLFFYYFAAILILGAQINAFFFEQYQPLKDGLGTYLSQLHQEHNVRDDRSTLYEENSERQ